MVQQAKISGRYSRAIFEYLGDKTRISQVVIELRELAELIKGSDELSQVFYTQLFSEPQKDGVVEDLGAKLNLTEDVMRILKVLSSAKRMLFLKEIADGIHRLLLESENTEQVRVESASNLLSEEKSSIEKRFEKMLGKKVEAAYVIDPSLIGGIKVIAGGRTFNGTLAGWFDAFEEKLVGL